MGFLSSIDSALQSANEQYFRREEDQMCFSAITAFVADIIIAKAIGLQPRPLFSIPMILIGGLALPPVARIFEKYLNVAIWDWNTRNILLLEKDHLIQVALFESSGHFVPSDSYLDFYELKQKIESLRRKKDIIAKNMSQKKYIDQRW